MLQVATGTDDLMRSRSGGHQRRLFLLPEETRWWRSTSRARCAIPCCQRLQDGTYQNLPEALRTYLVERLTQDAAERHINASIRASQGFQALLGPAPDPP